MMWNQIIFLVFLYTIFFVPIQLAFLDQESNFLIYMDQSVNICFFIDIILTFFTTIEVNGKDIN